MKTSPRTYSIVLAILLLCDLLGIGNLSIISAETEMKLLPTATPAKKPTVLPTPKRPNFPARISQATTTTANNVWTSIGPEGGEILTLAIDPQTPSTLYAGTSGGGVFKSTNSGATWAPINNTAMGDSIQTLLIDPITTTTLYAGTDLLGIFKSTDGGVNWNTINNGTAYPSGEIAINPITPTILYAGANSALFKTTNGGTSWSNSGAPCNRIFAIDPQTPNTVYSGSGSNVCKSVDDGATKNTSGLGGSASIQDLVIDPLTSTILYVGTSSNGVKKSTNGGTTWGASNTGLTELNVRVLAIDPQTPSTLYAGTYAGGIFKTTNGGASWSASSNGLSNLNIRTLAVDPQTPTTIYAGTLNGVFKSTDGGANWNASNTGLTGTDIHAVALDPQTASTIYAATPGNVFKTTNGGASWITINNGLTNLTVQAIAVNPQIPSTIYVGSNYGTLGLFKSTNAGTNWTTSLTNTAISAIAFDPQTPSTMYAAGTTPNFYVSTDSGETWSTRNITISANAYRIAIDPQTPTTMYLAANNGIYKSIDGGSNWNAIGPSLTLNLFYTLLIDPQTPTTLYSSTYRDGIYKSTNGGANWSQIGLELPWAMTYNWIQALTLDTQTPSSVYAGFRFSGVYKSTDGGANWSVFNTGLTTSRLNVLMANPRRPSTIFAGTGNGVYSINQTMGTITGRIADASNNGVADVMISDDEGNSVTTYASGVYTMTVGYGPYTITPSKAGYIFSPISRTVPVPPNATNQNFTATPIYSISGHIVDNNNNALAGVTLSAGANYTTTTDANGNYTLNGLPAGTYPLTPAKPGYTFSPALRNVTVPASATAQNFVGSLITYAVSGQIVTGSNSPLAGVTLSDGAGHSTTTDANGNYTLTGLVPGAYTLTPSKTGRIFSPASRAVTLPPNATNQNFISGSGTAPILQSIVPDLGLNSAPNDVTVYGANLEYGITVTVGGVALQNLTWVNAATVRGTLPAGGSPGAKDVVAQNPGSAPTNTLTNGYTVLDPSGDDLSVPSDGFWMNPPTIRSGDLVTLGVNVYRQGGTATLQPQVAFYHGDPLQGGVLIGTTTTPPLLPGFGRVISTTLTWNATGLSGTQSVCIVVDPNNLIVETTKANNRTCRTVTVQTTASDTTPPVITSLTINNGASTTTAPTVVVRLTASDTGSGVSLMYLIERDFNSTAHHWVPAQSTGWIPFTSAYTMTLTGVGGLRVSSQYFGEVSAKLLRNCDPGFTDFDTTTCDNHGILTARDDQRHAREL